MRGRRACGAVVVVCAFLLGAAAGDLERAREALAEGAFARALELARARLAENPRDAEARAIAGEAALQLGRLDEAERHFDRLARLEPDRPGLERARGRVALARAEDFARGGREKLARVAFEEALGHFDRALEQDPQDNLAREGRARALRGLGRAREALEDYRVWAERDPQASQPRAELARLALEAENLDEALAWFRSLPASTPAEVRQELAYELARALYKAGRATDADRLREHVPEGDPRGRLLDALHALFRTSDPFAAAETFASLIGEVPEEDRLALVALYYEGYAKLARAWRETQAGGSDQLPAPTMQLLPRYPGRARSLGFGARVYALVLVQPDGRPGRIEVVASELPRYGRVYRKEFEAAAREALARWTFRPAQRGGQPVPFPLVVLVEFRGG